MRSSRARILVALGGLAAVAAAQGGERFEALLWRNGGPELSPAFADAVRRTGLTGVSVDQDEDPGRAAALGLRFYLDHAAGKGILHLREKAFRDRLEEYERTRGKAALRRPNPLLSGSVRARLLGLVSARAGRAAKLGPLMISLDDEISTTRFVNPLDFCFDETTLAAFRVFLEARYGTIEAVDAAWGSRFASFGDVVPPTTDEVRRRQRGRLWPDHLTDWSDHHEFMEVVLAKTVALLARRAREVAPGVPVGFEGGQPPSAFGGFDWSRLLAAADYVEPYDIGGTRELVRSLKRPGTRHFETLFPEKDRVHASLAVAHLWDAAAHGLSGVIVWSSGRFFETTGRLTAYGELLARELPRLTGERGRVLANAEVYAGDIAVLESQASVRLHWFLDSAGDGASWTRRFGSWEKTHSTSQAARLSWIRLLQDLGFAFRFVTPAQLTEPRFGGGRVPHVLILPAALALSDGTLRAILRFAEGGGLVLADETPARYDDRLELRPHPGLDALFGVTHGTGRRWIREGRIAAAAPRTPSGLGLLESGLRPEGLTLARRLVGAAAIEAGPRGWIERPDGPRSGGSWCQFERSAGKGRAVLLNLGVAEYAASRLVEAKAAMCRDLRSRVLRILDRHGVREVALCRVRGYPTILERVLLTKGDRKILVVRANCLEDPALFQKLAAKGPQPMTVVLPVAARLRDLWTGQVVGRGGRRIDVTLDPVRGSFFFVEGL